MLKDEGVLPDCAGPWKYIHRRADDLDIYFLAGTGEAECTFRVRGKEPELWDPRPAAFATRSVYRTTADGRTTVTLGLPQNGSAFVVFRRPAHEPHLVSASGPDGRSGNRGSRRRGAQVRLWRAGQYVFQTSQGKQIALRGGRAGDRCP